MRPAGRRFFLAAFLLLQACSAAGTPAPLPSQPEPVSSLEGATVSPAPTPLDPFLERVRDTDYPLGAVDAPRTVRLADGGYTEGSSGADYLAVTMTGFLALGDLDADGENEAAALVAEQYGGSGAFYFLAVYENQGDEPVYAASTFIDDRPLLTGLSIQDGEIYVDATVHTGDDPVCCPSLPTSRRYRFFPPNLALTYYATQTPAGQPRAIAIQAPVDGAQVSGTVRLKGSVSVAPFENALVYRIFDMGGVELSAGPVEVDAPAPGAPGEFETAIDLGRILTNASIRIAVQEASAADGSLLAMDSILLQVR
ncbi:MAG: Gmad2 immunoglobulin-like domain-containing protein [Chloroflexota bacterium]